MKRMPWKIARETAKNGQVYFNIVASNGRVLVTSETYKNKDAMERIIKRFKFGQKITDPRDEV